MPADKIVVVNVHKWIHAQHHGLEPKYARTASVHGIVESSIEWYMETSIEWLVRARALTVQQRLSLGMRGFVIGN